MTAPGQVFASLLLLAVAAGAQAQPHPSLHERLFSAAAVAIDPELLARLDAAGERRLHAVLAFSEPLSKQRRARLREAGVALLSPLGRLAYHVSLPGPAERLLTLPGVERATLLRPEEKLAAGLATGEFEDWAFDPQTGRVAVLVEAHADVPPDELRRSLAALGLRAARHGPRTLRLRLEPAALRRLAGLDGVKRIEQGPLPFLPLNIAARERVRTNLAQQASFASPRPAYRVSGEGVRIGICDEGIDEDHDDFDEVGGNGGAGGSRVVQSRAERGSHGTHVASIAAGSGLNSLAAGEAAFDLRGHAPLAWLADYDAFASRLEDSYRALVGDATDLTNHSYVESLSGYETTAAGLDLLVRGDASLEGVAIPARVQVWAAGNNGRFAEYAARGAQQAGYHSVFTSAKNTISVGSVDALTGRLSDFSSLGPTLDGRIKPDLVAPGCRDSWAWSGIRAAQDGRQSYVGDCGTSMAAPVVAGIVALMTEEHRRSQEARGQELPALLPSTYKAMLVHTAEDQVKLAPHADREFDSPDTGAPVLYGAGPDFATGFGMVDAEQARRIVTLRGQWREDSVTEDGDRDEWCLRVPADAREVRATLAWDDAPADTDAATLLASGEPALVNDLDLELLPPGREGEPVLPWTLEPPPPDVRSQDQIGPAQRGVDRLNNVELASWPEPMAGIWRARVRGRILSLDGAQRYSLVTSHAIEACP
jgi:subtilisin family serine protease